MWMLKEFKCSELAEVVGGKASSGNITIDNISSLDSANASSISFLSDFTSYLFNVIFSKSIFFIFGTCSTETVDSKFLFSPEDCTSILGWLAGVMFFSLSAWNVDSWSNFSATSP